MNPPERKHEAGPPPDNRRLLRAILRSRRQFGERFERFERDIDNRFKLVDQQMRSNKDDLLQNEQAMGRKIDKLESIIRGEEDGGYIARVNALERDVERNTKALERSGAWHAGLAIGIIVCLLGIVGDLVLRILH